MSSEKNSESSTQQTLQQPVRYVGVGLHSGQRVSMRVRAGEENTGICFVRKDVPVGRGVIPARWHNVIDTQRCTAIGNEYGVSLRSIEHLMAGLRGCGIDNAVVELDGPEVPAMDGSSEMFVSMIERAGIVRQAAKRKVIRILKPIAVGEGDRFAILTPHMTTQLTVEIDFVSPAIGFQRFSVELTNGAFRRELAGARTFGFLNSIGWLHRMGLARGGSVSNAIVVDGDRVVNEEGLRFKDEFVRHKVLDCVGDLFLAGAPIVGYFHGYKPGHTLNHALVCELFANEDAWSYVTPDELDNGPTWWNVPRDRLTSAIKVARQWTRKIA
ncbi:MAG: UDP-3-O-acyl-N-acetylglucosamine deacetylase [Acidiferrobacterales bacterium]